MINYKTSNFELSPNSIDLEEANSISCSLSKFDNPFLNTYFHHFYFKYEIPLKRIVKKLINKKGKVLINLSKEADFIINQLTITLCKGHKEISIKKNRMYFLIRTIIFWKKYISIRIVFLVYSSYQILEFLRAPTLRKNITSSELVLISFCPTSYKKLREIYPNKTILYYKNDIFDQFTFPLNSLFSRKVRIILIFKILKKAILTINSTNKNVFFKNNITFKEYISKRVFQTHQTEIILKKYFSQIEIKKVISGLKDERYSYIINQLSKTYNFKTVAHPHGLAYSIKYPHGVFGHKYYCFTILEQVYLSKLYDNNFDLINKKRIIKKEVVLDKIVFFTDSRNPINDKKIIKLILDSDLKKRFYIKLHPNENKKIFKEYSSLIIDDFNTAISKSIVVSRSSTVLVDALFNNSLSISVLLDDVDKFNKRNLYPALMDSRIIEIESELNLINFLKIKLNKKISIYNYS